MPPDRPGQASTRRSGDRRSATYVPKVVTPTRRIRPQTLDHTQSLHCECDTGGACVSGVRSVTSLAQTTCPFVVNKDEVPEQVREVRFEFWSPPISREWRKTYPPLSPLIAWIGGLELRQKSLNMSYNRTNKNLTAICSKIPARVPPEF